MKVSWRITILIISINIVGFTLGSTNYTCNYIQNDVFEWNPQIYINKTCLNTTQCKRLYLIASINMPPYSLMDIVHRRLVQCCSCFNFLYPGQGGSYFRNTTELSSKAMERFDFIFPIAGHVKKQTSYGRYFIPLIEIPDYTYITHSLPTIGENMMESLKKVLPLTVICILMTIVSGFITWICETWYNSKEFPRPLITGWLIILSFRCRGQESHSTNHIACRQHLPNLGPNIEPKILCGFQGVRSFSISVSFYLFFLFDFSINFFDLILVFLGLLFFGAEMCKETHYSPRAHGLLKSL